MFNNLQDFLPIISVREVWKKILIINPAFLVNKQKKLPKNFTVSVVILKQNSRVIKLQRNLTSKNEKTKEKKAPPPQKKNNNKINVIYQLSPTFLIVTIYPILLNFM